MVLVGLPHQDIDDIIARPRSLSFLKEGLQVLFKATSSEGGGEGKHFCDYDCVSIPGKEEISTRFGFVSTNFVWGCIS